jgi:hypothetical protein
LSSANKHANEFGSYAVVIAFTELSFLHMQLNKGKQQSHRRRSHRYHRHRHRRPRRHHHNNHHQQYNHHQFNLNLISVHLRASLTPQKPTTKPVQISKYTKTGRRKKTWHKTQYIRYVTFA